MRSILVVGLFFLLMGCSDNKTSENLLETRKMEQVMWDMMRADELAGHYSEKDSNHNALNLHTNQYDKIFAVHGITKNQFKQSLDYYKSRPDLMKPIFDSLQARSERQLAAPAL
jgi:hypothetical protein